MVDCGCGSGWDLAVDILGGVQPGLDCVAVGSHLSKDSHRGLGFMGLPFPREEGSREGMVFPQVSQALLLCGVHLCCVEREKQSGLHFPYSLMFG